MSTAAATTPIRLPFPIVPYAQACWPSAARKVWNCLRYYLWRWGIKGLTITITDRVGSQWCTASYGEERYGSTGRRCWQKGLKQLEDIGAITRGRRHGGREITIILLFASKPKARPRKKAGQKPSSSPAGTSEAAAAQGGMPDVPATPEEFEELREQIGRARADGPAARATARGHADAVVVRKPKVRGIPADDPKFLAFRAEVEARERARQAAAAASEPPAPDPGTPPQPSGP